MESQAFSQEVFAGLLRDRFPDLVVMDATDPGSGHLFAGVENIPQGLITRVFIQQNLGPLKVWKVWVADIIAEDARSIAMVQGQAEHLQIVLGILEIIGGHFTWCHS